MKLILCSVFLAHGAVVYTVCTPVSGGGCLAPKSLDICAVPVALEACRTRSQTISQYKKKRPIPVCPLRGEPGRYKGLSHYGWQMSSDLSVNSSRNITIHFTIDAQGQVKNVTIAPFTSTVYQAVCNQLNQIRFTWCGVSLPPASTRFEKKICVR